jgi:hypothetical protein
MLAPNPSQHLESEIPFPRNLEASVRSRGTNGVDGTKRDLIEAGLSEPAGVGGSAMGIMSAPPGPRRTGVRGS